MTLHSAAGHPVKVAPSLPSPSQEETRFVIFTSGSTGVPKGVCLSEKNILAAADMLVQFLPLTPQTVSLVTVPLYDYYGMIQVFGHILGGASYLFGFTGILRHPLFSKLREQQCTDLVLVPHTLRLLLAPPRDDATAALRSVLRITTSSDLLTPDLLETLFALCPGVTVVNVYGLTEAGRACYKAIQRQTPVSRSIGLPSPGVQITIAGDRNNPGEIIIRGPNVMNGYLTGIKDNRIQFSPTTEMRTGDLGYYDDHGEIVLLGRRDHMINLMGMKIHPDEIEMAALRVPGITEARAKLAQGPQGGQEIHLEAVCPDQRVTAEQLTENMRATLPRAFVPARVTFVSSLARTDIGAKILRSPARP
jgi:acyl-CoA synthetase (AMP-forming)/AMP-acid ligase II